MMTLDLAVHEHVKQLRRAGPRPAERLAQHILRSGEGAVAPLLELATDTALLEADEPDCYAPIHALRLLGELRPLRMIEPLVRAGRIERPRPYEEAQVLWETELPQIIGRIGGAAVDPLFAIADDAAYPMEQRALALLALVCVTAADPPVRDQVVAGVRERFAASQDATLTAHLIAALANLGVAEAYSEVMARFRAREVAQEVIGPAQARQLLLSPSEARLACTNHPLWERYDEHGPHEEET